MLGFQSRVAGEGLLKIIYRYLKLAVRRTGRGVVVMSTMAICLKEPRVRLPGRDM